MIIKRSYFQLLLGSVTVGLFLANCTVQQAKDDGSCDKGDVENGCDCADGSVGHQVCNSDGVFGSCVCPNPNTAGGSSNSTAGKSSQPEGGEPSTGGNGGTAGTTFTGGEGGTSAVDPATGGAGGAPDLTFDSEDCESCLMVLCSEELNTCLDDATCASQYTQIIGCVDDVRLMMLAKRDAVRGCGVNVGSSPTASLQDVWAPDQLVDEATNLLNCMATSSSEEPSADWANDLPTNFPNNMPAPWPADSCAKLSCTSKYQ